jgi:nucleoside-diphosphate-sugar epimerase
MRYFVTGATGFLGGRVAKQLRAAGHEVVALVRDPAKATALQAEGVTLARGDVTDPDSLRAPMKGADGVFHIAGWYRLGLRDRSPGTAVNIEGTRNVLRAMRDVGVPKGVYTSTLAVNSDTHGKLVDETYRFEGKHLSEYDRTKAVAHDVAVSFIREGLPLVIVQPGIIYGAGGDVGPIHDFFVQFLKRQLPAKPKGTKYCLAHVDDVARGHLLAMERGRTGESYMLAGPAHEMSELMQFCEHVSGVRAPRMTAPPWMLKAMAGFMGVVERVVPVPPNFSGEYLRESAGTTYIGDASKARRELGWEARPIADCLPEVIRYEMAALQPK